MTDIQTYSMRINGKWLPASHSKTFDRFNPAAGRTVWMNTSDEPHRSQFAAR